MLTDIKYLILIVALTLIVCLARSTDKNGCKYNSDTCDPYLAQPCCEKNDVCQRGITQMTFYCMEADVLGRHCEIDRDCYKISYAICSKKKCVCKSNYVPHENDSICLPLLGENCESYEKCWLDNSICVDHRCECFDSYEQVNGQCQPNFLGLSCQNNEDCWRIKYAKCSGYNECSCKYNYIEIDQSTCQPLLGAICEKNEECFTTNSICIDNHCQCVDDFAPQSYHRCSPTYFDSKVKVNGKLFCPRNHIALNETICAPLLDEICLKSEFCLVENSACINSKCKCKPTYVARINNHCLPTHLYGSCNYDFDCYKIWAAECYNKMCVCKINYIPLNETTCSLRIGETCTKDEECLVENSICIDNKCQCRNYYDSISNNECEPVNYKYCVTNDDCTDKPHKECAKNKKCVCKTNYLMINGTSSCAPLIDGFCSRTADCFVKNSFCFLEKCRCKKFYEFRTVSSFDQCQPISIGHPCERPYDCKTIMYAECSADKICVCQTNYFAFNTTLCAPIIDGFCSNDEECRFNNSYCLYHTCQCKPNFFAVSDNQCVEKPSVVSCNKIIDCGDPWHVKCSFNHNCLCNSNTTQYNKATCLPLIGGLCWKDDQCVVKNSLCIDYHCQCISPTYVYAANNLCLPKIRSSIM